LKRFAALYRELDSITGNLARLAALRAYFEQAPPQDAAWAVYFLAGGKPTQVVPTRVLREATLAATGLPEWLFDESYDAVGDLAETMALLLPDAVAENDVGLAAWMQERLLPLRGRSPAEQIDALRRMWSQMDFWERFASLKLITGGMRVGVSRLLVTRALAQVGGIDPTLVAQRLVGYTARSGIPDAAAYAALLAPATREGATDPGGAPYPFFLAHPLQAAPDDFPRLLGAPADWMIEWKWDGIRAQLVRRNAGTWLWSRGEDLITERFPELAAAAGALPQGTVLDGEIVVWKDDRVAPFALLQRRIGRKTLTPKILAEAPVVLLAFDVLEHEGRDVRALPLAQRRPLLEELVRAADRTAVRLSPLLREADWSALARQRENSRTLGVEGLLLKQAGSQYGVGRTKAVGTWWKWKIDPYTVDAVLVYAQPGNGKRANLFTDYTFAVWDDLEAPADDPRLVPFAKAYSGLTDEEIREVDAFVRRNTLERFGPVRSVRPQLVFELGFEAIAPSTRHKSGVAVRFPRILRWRHDKPVVEADTLTSLRALLAQRRATNERGELL
jgi:DNA ligase-1